MKKLKNCISVLLAAVIMTAAFCTPALAVVSTHDQKHLSTSQQSKIDTATKAWEAANAAGDRAGMDKAHAAAEAVRATASYSGGADGSEYHPWNSGGGNSGGGGGGGSGGGGYYYPPAPVTYTITATSGTGGSISPSGSTSVTEGNSKTYTITANTGHKIADVKVDGSSIGAVSTYTFTGVSSSHSISATFASAASLSAGGVTLGDGAPGRSNRA